MVAATSILIPVQAHYLSAKGLEMLLTTASKIKKSLNPNLNIMGILLTMHNERLNFTKAILAQLEESYGNHIRIFENKIPHSVKAVENLVDTVTTGTDGKATSKSLPLGDYKVKEIQAPTEYVLNANTFNAKLAYGSQTDSIVYDDVSVPNEPQTGTIKITKQDNETDGIPQGDTTLNGAIFEI